MSKKDDALKLAMDWYDSGNENPDDFANMIKQVIALSHAPEVREQPAQQREPVAWMKDCADFWEHYTYISEASQENYKAEAQMWVEKLRTSPPASKPLTDEQKIAEALRRHGLTLVKTAAGYDVLKLGQIAAHSIKRDA